MRSALLVTLVLMLGAGTALAGDGYPGSPGWSPPNVSRPNWGQQNNRGVWVQGPDAGRRCCRGWKRVDQPGKGGSSYQSFGSEDAWGRSN